MNILLFGANGQLGTALRTLLAAKGTVRALDRNGADLTDLPRLRALIAETRPQIIVNAAAYTAVDAAESDAEVARLVNADAPRIMAEAARERGALLVHFSTDYVFDGTAQQPYDETAATNPLGVYGATKLAGEQGVAATGADHLILRTAWLYSNRGRNFLNTMLRLTETRDELRVVNDQTGSPTYADLVAEATLKILEHWYASSRAHKNIAGLYHISSAGQTTWWDFARRIMELTGQDARVRVTPITTAEYPTPVTRPAYSVLSNEKLHRTFGLQLPDWESGLQRCLADRNARG